MPTRNDSSKDKPTDTQLGGFHRRAAALSSRVVAGEIGFEATMQTMQDLLDSKRLVTFSLMPSPLSQLKTARMLNVTSGWGLDIDLFDPHRWGQRLPSKEYLQSLKSTQAVVLDIGLNTFEETLKAAWALIKASQLPIGDNLGGTARLESFNEEFARNWLAWRTIDFAAHIDESPAAVVRASGRELPASAIFWALVYNPNLLEALRDFEIYKIWFAGCKIKDEEADVPILGYDSPSGRLEFNPGHPGNSWNGRSIPEFVTNGSWY